MASAIGVSRRQRRAPGRSGPGLATTARDVVFAVLLTILLAVLAATLLRSGHGTSIILPSGGVIAGLLIMLPPARWWPYVLVGGWGQAAYFMLVGGLSAPVTALRAAADIVALLTYASIIRRNRKPKSGLGANLPVVVAAAFASALIREVPIVALQLSSPTAESINLRTVGVEAFLGTVIGVIIGSAVVLGLDRWPETKPWHGRPFRLDVALVVALLLALVATFLTDLGAVVPGSQYFIAAGLFVGAARLSIPFVAVVSAATAVTVASAATKGTGVFDRAGPASTTDVLEAQAYLFALVLTVFLISATMDQRRIAERTSRAAAETRQGMFDASPVASAWVLIEADDRVRVRQANPAFGMVLGIVEDQAEGAFLDELLATSPHRVKASQLTGIDLAFKLPSGKSVWLRPTLARFGGGDVAELAATPGSEPWGRGWERDVDPADLGGTILVLEDVTAAHTFDDLMRRQSQRDPLTGLANRTALLERLDRRVREDGRTGVTVTVINIDGLREINATFGYATGDHVLVHVASRLKTAMGHSDFVARIGGDDFAVVTDEVRSGGAQEAFAEQLLRAIAEPLALAGQSIVVTASVGVASSSQARDTEADVLRRADTAIGTVKANSRNRIGHFSEGRGDTASLRFDAEARLRHALHSRSLVCHFQPLVDLRTGLVVSAEALVRLPAAEGGFVPPLHFIPLAAELGLLGQLTEQVCEQACAVVQQWQADGHPLHIAVNAPPSWLTPQATDFIAKLLESHHLQPGSLTLEITEDELLDLGGDQLAVMADLKAMGVKLAIDDFGTGYSGLSSFLAVPSDFIKIDRTFISALHNSDDELDLVASMIDLIHHFGKQAVAEGIETTDQYLALARLGCDLGQGFLMSRPVPADDLTMQRYQLPTAPLAGES